MFKTLSKKWTASLLVAIQIATALPSDSSAQISRTLSPKMSSVSLQALNWIAPEKWGKVDVRQKGSSSKTLILIEDAHAAAEAQQSIQKIIESLRTQNGVGEVFLEGLFDQPDLTLFRSFPNQSWLREKIEQGVAQSDLSGGAAALILNPARKKPGALEDKQSYLQAVKAYQNTLIQREALLATINSKKIMLSQKIHESYSSDAEALEKFLDTLSGNWEAETFEAGVRILTDRHRHNLASHPELLSLNQLTSPLAFYRRPIVRLTFEKILQKNNQAGAWLQDLRTSRKTVLEIAGDWENQGVLENWTGQPLDLSEQKLVQKLMLDAQAFSHIKNSEWQNKLEKLAEQALNDLLGTHQNKKLHHSALQFRFFTRLIKLELNREDWNQVHSGNLKLKRVDVWKPFIDFYAVQHLREDTFEKRFQKFFEQSNIAVTVAGGFHRNAVLDFCKRHGWSVIAVRPNFQKIPAENVYTDLMLGKVSWSKNFKEVHGEIDLQNAYLQSLVEKLANEKKEIAYDELLRWRQDLIRLLANENRIGDFAKYSGFMNQNLARLIPAQKKDRLRKAWQERIHTIAEKIQILRSKNNFNIETLTQTLRPAGVQAPVLLPFMRLPAEFVAPRQRSESRAISEIEPVQKVKKSEKLSKSLFIHPTVGREIRAEVESATLPASRSSNWHKRWKDPYSNLARRLNEKYGHKVSANYEKFDGDDIQNYRKARFANDKSVWGSHPSSILYLRERFGLSNRVAVLAKHNPVLLADALVHDQIIQSGKLQYWRSMQRDLDRSLRPFVGRVFPTTMKNGRIQIPSEWRKGSEFWAQAASRENIFYVYFPAGDIRQIAAIFTRERFLKLARSMPEPSLTAPNVLTQTAPYLYEIEMNKNGEIKFDTRTKAPRTMMGEEFKKRKIDVLLREQKLFLTVHESTNKALAIFIWSEDQLHAHYKVVDGKLLEPAAPTTTTKTRSEMRRAGEILKGDKAIAPSPMQAHKVRSETTASRSEARTLLPAELFPNVGNKHERLVLLHRFAIQLINQNESEAALFAIHEMKSLVEAETSLRAHADYIHGAYLTLIQSHITANSLDLARLRQTEAKNFFNQYSNQGIPAEKAEFILMVMNMTANAYIANGNRNKAEAILDEAREIFDAHQEYSQVKPQASYILQAYQSLVGKAVKHDDLILAERVAGKVQTFFEKNKKVNNVQKTANHTMAALLKAAKGLRIGGKIVEAQNLIESARKIFDEFSSDFRSVEIAAFYLMLAYAPLAKEQINHTQFQKEAEENMAKAWNLFLSPDYYFSDSQREDAAASLIATCMNFVHSLVRTGNRNEAIAMQQRAFDLLHDYPANMKIVTQTAKILKAASLLMHDLIKQGSFDKANKILSRTSEILYDYSAEKEVLNEAAYILSAHTRLAWQSMGISDTKNLADARKHLDEALRIVNTFISVSPELHSQAKYIANGYIHLAELTPATLDARRLAIIARRIIKNHNVVLDWPVFRRLTSFDEVTQPVQASKPAEPKMFRNISTPAYSGNTASVQNSHDKKIKKKQSKDKRPLDARMDRIDELVRSPGNHGQVRIEYDIALRKLQMQQKNGAKIKPEHKGTILRAAHYLDVNPPAFLRSEMREEKLNDGQGPVHQWIQFAEDLLERNRTAMVYSAIRKNASKEAVQVIAGMLADHEARNFEWPNTDEYARGFVGELLLRTGNVQVLERVRKTLQIFMESRKKSPHILSGYTTIGVIATVEDGKGDVNGNLLDQWMTVLENYFKSNKLMMHPQELRDQIMASDSPETLARNIDANLPATDFFARSEMRKKEAKAPRKESPEMRKSHEYVSAYEKLKASLFGTPTPSASLDASEETSLVAPPAVEPAAVIGQEEKTEKLKVAASGKPAGKVTPTPHPAETSREKAKRFFRQKMEKMDRGQWHLASEEILKTLSKDDRAFYGKAKYQNGGLPTLDQVMAGSLKGWNYASNAFIRIDKVIRAQKIGLDLLAERAKIPRSDLIEELLSALDDLADDELLRTRFGIGRQREVSTLPILIGLRNQGLLESPERIVMNPSEDNNDNGGYVLQLEARAFRRLKELIQQKKDGTWVQLDTAKDKAVYQALNSRDRFIYDQLYEAQKKRRPVTAETVHSAVIKEFFKGAAIESLPVVTTISSAIKTLWDKVHARTEGINRLMEALAILVGFKDKTAQAFAQLSEHEKKILGLQHGIGINREDDLAKRAAALEAQGVIKKLGYSGIVAAMQKEEADAETALRSKLIALLGEKEAALIPPLETLRPYWHFDREGWKRAPLEVRQLLTPADLKVFDLAISEENSEPLSYEKIAEQVGIASAHVGYVLHRIENLLMNGRSGLDELAADAGLSREKISEELLSQLEDIRNERILRLLYGIGVQKVQDSIQLIEALESEELIEHIPSHSLSRATRMSRAAGRIANFKNYAWEALRTAAEQNDESHKTILNKEKDVAILRGMSDVERIVYDILLEAQTARRPISGTGIQEKLAGISTAQNRPELTMESLGSAGRIRNRVLRKIRAREDGIRMLLNDLEIAAAERSLVEKIILEEMTKRDRRVLDLKYGIVSARVVLAADRLRILEVENFSEKATAKQPSQSTNDLEAIAFRHLIQALDQKMGRVKPRITPFEWTPELQTRSREFAAAAVKRLKKIKTEVTGEATLLAVQLEISRSKPTDSEIPMATSESLASVLVHMREGKPLVPENMVPAPVQTAIGLIDLSRLNHPERYMKNKFSATVELARDLTLAHHLGWIRLVPYKSVGAQSGVHAFLADRFGLKISKTSISWAEWYVRHEKAVEGVANVETSSASGENAQQPKDSPSAPLVQQLGDFQGIDGLAHELKVTQEHARKLLGGLPEKERFVLTRLHGIDRDVITVDALAAEYLQQYMVTPGPARIHSVRQSAMKLLHATALKATAVSVETTQATIPPARPTEQLQVVQAQPAAMSIPAIPKPEVQNSLAGQQDELIATTLKELLTKAAGIRMLMIPGNQPRVIQNGVNAARPWLSRAQELLHSRKLDPQTASDFEEVIIQIRALSKKSERHLISIGFASGQERVEPVLKNVPKPAGSVESAPRRSERTVVPGVPAPKTNTAPVIPAVVDAALVRKWIKEDFQKLPVNENTVLAEEEIVKRIEATLNEIHGGEHQELSEAFDQMMLDKQETIVRKKRKAVSQEFSLLAGEFQTAQYATQKDSWLSLVVEKGDRFLDLAGMIRSGNMPIEKGSETLVEVVRQTLRSEMRSEKDDTEIKFFKKIFLTMGIVSAVSLPLNYFMLQYAQQNPIPGFSLGWATGIWGGVSNFLLVSALVFTSASLSIKIGQSFERIERIILKRALQMTAVTASLETLLLFVELLPEKSARLLKYYVPGMTFSFWDLVGIIVSGVIAYGILAVSLELIWSESESQVMGSQSTMGHGSLNHSEVRVKNHTHFSEKNLKLRDGVTTQRAIEVLEYEYPPNYTVPVIALEETFLEEENHAAEVFESLFKKPSALTQATRKFTRTFFINLKSHDAAPKRFASKRFMNFKKWEGRDQDYPLYWNLRLEALHLSILALMYALQNRSEQRGVANPEPLAAAISRLYDITLASQFVDFMRTWKGLIPRNVSFAAQDNSLVLFATGKNGYTVQAEIEVRIEDGEVKNALEIAKRIIGLSRKASAAKKAQVPEAAAIPSSTDSASSITQASRSSLVDGPQSARVRSEMRKGEKELLERLVRDWPQIKEQGSFLFDVSGTVRWDGKISGTMAETLAWLLREGVHIGFVSGVAIETLHEEILQEIFKKLDHPAQYYHQITVYAGAGALKLKLNQQDQYVIDEAYSNRFALSPEIEQKVNQAVRKFFTDPEQAHVKEFLELHGKTITDIAKSRRQKGGGFFLNTWPVKKVIWDGDDFWRTHHNNKDVPVPALLATRDPSRQRLFHLLLIFMPILLGRDLRREMAAFVTKELGGDAKLVQFQEANVSSMHIMHPKASKKEAIDDYLKYSGRAKKQTFYFDDDFARTTHHFGVAEEITRIKGFAGNTVNVGPAKDRHGEDRLGESRVAYHIGSDPHAPAGALTKNDDGTRTHGPDVIIKLFQKVRAQVGRSEMRIVDRVNFSEQIQKAIEKDASWFRSPTEYKAVFEFSKQIIAKSEGEGFEAEMVAEQKENLMIFSGVIAGGLLKNVPGLNPKEVRFNFVTEPAQKDGVHVRRMIISIGELTNPVLGDGSVEDEAVIQKVLKPYHDILFLLNRHIPEREVREWRWTESKLSQLRFNVAEMIEGSEMQSLSLQRQVAIMKIIGARLRAAWKREGLEERFGFIGPYLVWTNYSFQKPKVFLRRYILLDALLASDDREHLHTLWHSGVGLAQHLRFYGLHMETIEASKENIEMLDYLGIPKQRWEKFPGKILVNWDNEFLMHATRGFMRLLKNQWNHPEMPGKVGDFTEREAMAWGLLTMTDPLLQAPSTYTYPQSAIVDPRVYIDFMIMKMGVERIDLLIDTVGGDRDYSIDGAKVKRFQSENDAVIQDWIRRTFIPQKGDDFSALEAVKLIQSSATLVDNLPVSQQKMFTSARERGISYFSPKPFWYFADAIRHYQPMSWFQWLTHILAKLEYLNKIRSGYSTNWLVKQILKKAARSEMRQLNLTEFKNIFGSGYSEVIRFITEMPDYADEKMTLMTQQVEPSRGEVRQYSFHYDKKEYTFYTKRNRREEKLIPIDSEGRIGQLLYKHDLTGKNKMIYAANRSLEILMLPPAGKEIETYQWDIEKLKVFGRALREVHDLNVIHGDLSANEGTPFFYKQHVFWDSDRKRIRFIDFHRSEVDAKPEDKELELKNVMDALANLWRSSLSSEQIKEAVLKGYEMQRASSLIEARSEIREEQKTLDHGLETKDKDFRLLSGWGYALSLVSIAVARLLSEGIATLTTSLSDLTSISRVVSRVLTSITSSRSGSTASVMIESLRSKFSINVPTSVAVNVSSLLRMLLVPFSQMPTLISKWVARLLSEGIATRTTSLNEQTSVFKDERPSSTASIRIASPDTPSATSVSFVSKFSISVPTSDAVKVLLSVMPLASVVFLSQLWVDFSAKAGIVNINLDHISFQLSAFSVFAVLPQLVVLGEGRESARLEFFRLGPPRDFRRSEMREDVTEEFKKFGIQISDDGENINYSKVPQNVDWVMDSLRPEEIKPLVTDVKLLPEVKLLHDLYDYPKISGGSHELRLAIAEINGKQQPVVFKRGFPENFERLQLIDRLGAGPHFYGLVRDASGKPIGYALQLVIGDTHNLVYDADVYERDGIELLQEKLRRVGGGAKEVMEIHSHRGNGFVVVDADDVGIFSSPEYDAFIQRLRRSEMRGNEVTSKSLTVNRNNPRHSPFTIPSRVGSSVGEPTRLVEAVLGLSQPDFKGTLKWVNNAGDKFETQLLKVLDQNFDELLAKSIEQDSMRLIDADKMVRKSAPAISALTDQGLSRFREAILSKTVLKTAPVIFYSPEIEFQLIQLIQVTREAFEKINPGQVAQHFKFSIVAQSDEEIEMLKLRLGNVTGIDFYTENQQSLIQIRRRVIENAEWRGHYGVFFGSEAWNASMTIWQRNFHAENLPATAAFALMPDMMAYFSVTTNEQINSITLVQSLPNWAIHLRFESGKGISLLESVLSALSLAYKPFAIAA